MSRREYVHTFFDVMGYYTTLMEQKSLTELEWEIKENKHNIEVLEKERRKREKEDEKGIPICKTMEEVYERLKSPSDIDRVFIQSGKEPKILIRKE